MGIRIPDLLNGILEATAAEAAAKARITTLRAALEDEGRRRLKADGAAPSWAAPRLGKVRLDPPGEWTATIADAAAFGSYVAQHYPTEATAAIEVPAADLADALQALKFVGIDVIEARTNVRAAWSASWLEGLAVDVEEETDDDDGSVDRTITVVDPSTGVLVDGLTAERKPAKLVVTLDRDRRTAAVEEAKATATALLDEATGDDAPDVDLDALDVRRRELEGLHSDQLVTIAKARELGSSGTKAALAERIARAELATGHVIRPGVTPLDEAIAIEGAAPTWTAEPSDPAADLAAAKAAVEADEYDPRVIAATLVEAIVDAAPLPARGHRYPYVGEGADGARRSAQIDREEADGYDREDPRRAAALASAERWEAQAAEEEAAATEPEEPARIPIDDRDHFTGAERGSVAYLNAKRAEAIADAVTREELRRLARAKGINPGGTKADVATRLAEAGVTAEDLRP